MRGNHSDARLLIAGFVLIACVYVEKVCITWCVVYRAREVLEQQGISSGLLPTGPDHVVTHEISHIGNPPEPAMVSPTSAPSIHDAHRSAFERTTKTNAIRHLRGSDVSGSGSVGQILEPGGSAHGAAWPVNGSTSPNDTQPVVNGSQKISSARISPSPSWAEQRENGAGDPSGPQLSRVETFSEVRKRFEEAHAAGLLHESTAC